MLIPLPYKILAVVLIVGGAFAAGYKKGTDQGEVLIQKAANEAELLKIELENEQKNTRYDLRSKFTLTDTVDVMITEVDQFTDDDIRTLHKIRLSIPYYEPGEYQIGNMLIEIKKGL
jgi:hypothetical protein